MSLSSSSWFRFLASLRLTIVCLLFGLIVIFVGTLDQVHLGIHEAQKKYFDSWLIWWTIPKISWTIPILPGGFLLSSILLVNLICAHQMRFQASWKKLGISLIHGGLILIIAGQLATSLFSIESQMRIPEGASMNFSESIFETELSFVNTSPSDHDQVYSFPAHLLAPGKTLRHPTLPFEIQVLKYFPNSHVTPLASGSTSMVTHGDGKNLEIHNLPLTFKPDERNVNSAIIELISPNGSLGTWLVGLPLEGEQSFTYQDKTWRIQLRLRRYYKDYSIQLLDFTHEKYTGTDVPRNFSSKIRLVHPALKEDREVLIYMNNPLRYQGETYYQSGFTPDNKATVLQVVKNPGWLVPYLSCILISIGMIWQFMGHLLTFLRKQTS